jgi:hypothetical protein
MSTPGRWTLRSQILAKPTAKMRFSLKTKPKVRGRFGSTRYFFRHKSTQINTVGVTLPGKCGPIFASAIRGFVGSVASNLSLRSNLDDYFIVIQRFLNKTRPKKLFLSD